VVAVFIGLNPKDFVVYYSEDELDNLIRGGYINCYLQQEKEYSYLYNDPCIKIETLLIFASGQFNFQ
jgi:hypothetical protein